MRHWPKVLIAIIAISPLTLMLGVPEQAHSSTPVSGDVSHDFSEVVLRSASDKLEHRFQLLNQSKERLKVMKVGSSCGCSKAVVSQTEILAGEKFHVDAEFSVSTPGRRNAKIWLHVQDFDEPITLHLSATGKSLGDFYAVPARLRFDNEGTRSLVLVVTALENISPPAIPQVVAPSGVITNFKGWVFSCSFDAEIGRPARYQGTLDVDISRVEEPSGVMEVSVDGRNSLKVPLSRGG